MLKRKVVSKNKNSEIWKQKSLTESKFTWIGKKLNLAVINIYGWRNKKNKFGGS